MGNKKLKIEIKDWHYQCGDGCCDNYGTDIYLNGELVDTVESDDLENVLEKVLTLLHYEVEITRTQE